MYSFQFSSFSYNVVVNLTTKTSNIEVTPVLLPSTIDSKFDFAPIKYFNELDLARQKRIGGFTYNYLVEQQAVLKRQYDILPPLELEVELEKHEYSHVKKSLEIIEEGVKKIGPISQNVWQNLHPSDNKVTIEEIIRKTNDFYEFHKTLTKALSTYT